MSRGLNVQGENVQWQSVQEKMSRGRNVLGEKCLGAKCPGKKCPFGILSMERNVQEAKNPAWRNDQGDEISKG